MANVHQPVMLAAVIRYLRPKSGQHFVDCTLGGGGHARAILERTRPDGRLIGIDLDPAALALTAETLKPFKQRAILVEDNFKNLTNIIHVHQFDKVNGVLFDLGLSSNQLQDRARGFSFLADGPLDMRFGTQEGLTAQQILSQYSESQLVDIFQAYGQERLARPIAHSLVTIRRVSPISTPQQLISIVSRIYKKYYRGRSKMNPATKVFQALRIAVNDELENLSVVLPHALAALRPGGRIAVVTYHSLEDKIVKDFFKLESQDCICPPEQPTCQCKHKQQLTIITKKPIKPSAEETAANPRSRSAQLRVAEKI